MGYMGFGMRKEVYKRKPKKPFKRFKKFYENDIPKREKNPDAPEFTSEEVLNKPRFKSIHDFKAFRVIKALILLSLIGAFIYAVWVKQWLDEIRTIEYQQHLIESFLPLHDSIFTLTKQLSLQYANFDSNQYTLVAKSNQYLISDNPKLIWGIEKISYGTWNANAISMRINNDSLFYQNKDSVFLTKKYWTIVYESDIDDQDYRTMLSSLNIDSSIVSKIRHNLRSVKFKETYYQDSIAYLPIEVINDYGTYEYIQITDTSAVKKFKGVFPINKSNYLRRKS